MHLFSTFYSHFSFFYSFYFQNYYFRTKQGHLHSIPPPLATPYWPLALTADHRNYLHGLHSRVKVSWVTSSMGCFWGRWRIKKHYLGDMTSSSTFKECDGGESRIDIDIDIDYRYIIDVLQIYLLVYYRYIIHVLQIHCRYIIGVI